MPIEKLNMWIKESVVSNITRLQIIKFIWRLNFMQHVNRAVKRIVFAKRSDDSSPKLRDIRVDVDKIKAFLRTKIGTAYAAATQPSNDNLLSVDMSDWGGRAYPRTNAPFQQLRNAQNG